MSGNSHADFAARCLCDRVSDLIGDGRIFVIGEFLLIFFLGKFGVLFGDRAFRDNDDREAAAALVSLLDSLDNLVDVVGDLREQDDVRAARDACVERKPSDFVAHDLHNKDAAMGARCRVNVIDALCRDINCALEAEGHVRAPQIVVDGLGKSDYIESFFTEQVGRLVRAVAAAHDQTVKLQFVICLLHCRHFVDSVLIGLADRLEGNAACSEDRAASCKNALKILSRQNAELAVDQALVAVFKSVELHRFFGVVDDAFEYAAHRGIERLAVAAACQKTDSQHLLLLLDH